jgi:beta-1,4-mannosyl-glycoprotein beta-1,4-N-acetylglucosaminyltransferase
MKKIYDTFCFFNELDILELRLNILDPYVDYFVIVESDVTHSGESKPFYYEDNKERFSKFSDKIISYKIYDTPKDFTNLPEVEDIELNNIFRYCETSSAFDSKTQPDYGRDFFQKESVRRALVDCDDDDIIMISDADEIPNPELISQHVKMKLDTTIYSLNQITYYYYLNVLKQTDWFGTKLGTYKNIKKHSFNELRNNVGITQRISDGGWHFSFMGGEKMVKNKILSYSARDMADDNVLSNISSNIKNNIDPFFRGSLTKVDIDSSYPEYILNNLQKYQHMIK